MKCIGIDGESISPFGYCLLSSSIQKSLSVQRKLTSRECFEFILSLHEKGARLFGYGIGYDVCHWVADLSDDEKTKLATKGMVYTMQGATCYRVTYRPNAYFTVQRLAGLGKSAVTGTATIVDLMRWHRKPFVDVCEEWRSFSHVPDADFLRFMKAGRETFDCDAYRVVNNYCERECEALATLGEEMTSRLYDLGIPVSHPFTAGTVAGALMARNKVQDHWQTAPEGVQDAISRAFFGGREQCSRYGHFENVTQWDIRSAYGWAMTQLPDMNGRWFRGDVDISPALTPWSLYKVQWDIDEGKHTVMPFPWRDEDGRVHYPPRGTGWQWSPIVRASLRNYPDANIAILDAWHYMPIGDIYPFWYIRDLYEARRTNPDDPVAGLLKSIIVATWGRMCSPGQRASKTRGQLDWAGMVTALIQERMLDAIHRTGEGEFISCCVDGFWSENTGKLPSDFQTSFSTELGGWSNSEADELLLLRPACYWKRVLPGETEGMGGWSAHTSGVPGGEAIIDAALEQWRSPGGWRRGRLDLTLRRVKGLLACSVNGDYDQLGKFVELPLSVSFNPGMGRMGHECPTMKHGYGWRRWLSYWPPKAELNSESASFASRTGLIDDRWKERQEANAIEETNE